MALYVLISLLEYFLVCMALISSSLQQVEYVDLRAAETAIQTLSGRKIFDTEIKVNWAYQNQTAKEDVSQHCQ